MPITHSLAEGWNQDHERAPREKDPSRYAIEKERLFPRNSLIIDIGGGRGAEDMYFMGKGHKVILVDISDVALKVARDIAHKQGLYNKLETRQDDLSRGAISVADGVADVVYSRMALHYFGRETTIKLLKDINRILKSGGRAYLTLKSPGDAVEMASIENPSEEIEPGVFMDGWKKKSRFTKTQLTDMAKEAGIANVEIEPYTEDLGGRNDQTKSGNEIMLLNEIIISKE